MGLAVITVKRDSTFNFGCAMGIPTEDCRGLLDGLSEVNSICEKIECWNDMNGENKIPAKYFVSNLVSPEYCVIGPIGSVSFPYMPLVESKYTSRKLSSSRKKGFIVFKRNFVEQMLQQSTSVFTLHFQYKHQFSGYIEINGITKISKNQFEKIADGIKESDIFRVDSEMRLPRLSGEIHYLYIDRIMKCLDGYNNQEYIVSGNDIYKLSYYAGDDE